MKLLTLSDSSRMGHLVEQGGQAGAYMRDDEE